MSALAWAVLTGVPALPLSMTLLNLLTWRRGSVHGDTTTRVSVLVPARNEQASIEACVRAIAACAYPIEEILVYDDQSSDRTLPILQALARELPQLRVLTGGPLPAGWVGKPHACAQLGRAARGEVLFFVDADTKLEPFAVQRMLSFMRGAHGAELVSAVPRQELGSLAERAMIPLLHLTYTSWLPLFMVANSKDPRLLAANGQLLAVRRALYERIGGFGAVASEIVDDMAFCRRAKAQGARVAFADGMAIARCRMYRSLREIWAGFSKNLYEGIGATPLSLALVLLLHLTAFVAPYLALGATLLGPAPLASALFWPALSGVLLNVLLRTMLALSFKQPAEGVLLHPLSIVALCILAVNSCRWSARGRLHWAGRCYGDRKQRLSVSP